MAKDLTSMTRLGMSFEEYYPCGQDLLENGYFKDPKE